MNAHALVESFLQAENARIGIKSVHECYAPGTIWGLGSLWCMWYTAKNYWLKSEGLLAEGMGGLEASFPRKDNFRLRWSISMECKGTWSHPVVSEIILFSSPQEVKGEAKGTTLHAIVHTDDWIQGCLVTLNKALENNSNESLSLLPTQETASFLLMTLGRDQNIEVYHWCLQASLSEPFC